LHNRTILGLFQGGPQLFLTPSKWPAKKIKHFQISGCIFNKPYFTPCTYFESNTAKYYFGEKASFLHAFQKFVVNQEKFVSSPKAFSFAK
jgi:hypothetical protein